MSVENQVLSNRVLEMEPSATIAMAQKARDLKAKGYDIISLSLGEPDFDTPDHIKQAAKKALDDGITKYTPVSGLASLKSAIQTKLKRDNNIDATLNQIVVSNGAKQSIANLCMSMLNPGDEAVLLAPYWVSYKGLVELNGATPIIVEAGIDQDYKPTAAQVKAAITPKTKFVIFSSPCNPSGSLFTEEELKAIGDALKDFENLYIIVDEIYEYINFGTPHYSLGSYEPVKDKVITVNGFAKGYAMTGWRLGYIAAPAFIAKACEKIQGQITSGANSFSQEAAAFALLADMKPTFDMVEIFKKRRDLVLKGLSEIEGIRVNNPKGAFYVFPDISALFGKSYNGTTINTSSDFCEYILEESHVACVAGDAFGVNDCFRLSYAASEAHLEEALKRMKAAIDKLN